MNITSPTLKLFVCTFALQALSRAQGQYISAIEETPQPVPVVGNFGKSSLSGKLASINYLPVKGEQNWQFFLTLASTGPQQGTQSFHVKTPTYIFEPLISPDAKKVIFKFGWPNDRFGGYSIYFFDPQSKQFRIGPKLAISCRRIRWSPNGRYLAFVSGGDAEGNTWPGQTEPLRLFTYDIDGDKLKQLDSDIWVRQFEWSTSNTLLYASYGPAATNMEGKLPNIYEHNPTSGETTVKRQLASSPTQSPDGAWLAYWGDPYGSENKANTKAPTDTQTKPARGVNLLNQITGNVKPVLGVSNTDFEASSRWSSDGKVLVVAKYTYEKGEGVARVGCVSTSDGVWRQIARLTAKDKVAMLRNRAEPQFEILDVPVESNKILFKSEEITGIVNDMVETSVSLLEVDRTMGVVTRVLSVKNPLGLSWRPYQAQEVDEK